MKTARERRGRRCLRARADGCGPAPEHVDVRGHHLPIDPWRVALACGAGVVRHDPAVRARALLLCDREEACVAGGALKATDELDGALARLPPLVGRRQSVDGRRLGQQRAEHEVDKLLVPEAQPTRRELVAVGRVAREEQDLGRSGARQSRGVETPRNGDLQLRPRAEAALLRSEELGAEARGVAVLVPPDGHEITGLCELEGDLADAAAVHGRRFLGARRHRLPLQPVAGLLEEHQDVLGAVVVPQVARLVGGRVLALAEHLDLPRHLALVADLLGLLPRDAVLRCGVEDVQWLELPMGRLQAEEVQHQLPLHFEEQRLPQVAPVRESPLDVPRAQVDRMRDHDARLARGEVHVRLAVGQDVLVPEACYGDVVVADEPRDILRRLYRAPQEDVQIGVGEGDACRARGALVAR